MPLGPAARQITGEAARQSAEGLVPEPRRGHCGRRFHCDLSSAKATAGDHRAARVGLRASLPLPRVTARHAPTSDRHRAVQFVEFKPNEYIKVARNPDYWKSGRPYL